MYINKVTFVFIFFLHTIYGFQFIDNNNIDTLETDAGKSVILHCKSNDDSHNFMFWHHISKTGVVIGPRNEYNSNKYKYELLSGNLTIRAVSPKDIGLYNCVSDGINKRDISVHSVNLILKDWEIKQEKLILPNVNNDNNSGGNLWKVSAILGSILVILILILVALHVYHKERPNYFDIIEQNDEDEDSTEELFTREPSTSGTKKTNNLSGKNEGIDNFEKVYTTINNKENTTI